MRGSHAENDPVFDQTSCQENPTVVQSLPESSPSAFSTNTSPGATVIQGQGPAGATAMRCAYVGSGAVLAGFTLTNGCTMMGGPGVFASPGNGAGMMPGIWV